MNRRVSYHPKFADDVREAGDWYDAQSPGLGAAFVEIVRARIDEVIRDPERFGRSSIDYRYTRVPRFPYLVFFDWTADELQFFGVMHTARSIEKWRIEREGA